MWRYTVSFVALLALATAVGCGGSSDSASTEEPPALTKAKLISKGDKICTVRLEEKNAVVQQTLEKMAEKNEDTTSLRALTELVESAAPALQGLISDLSDLPASKSDENTIDTIVGELDAGLKKLESNPRSLTETDPFAKASKTAESFGLEACAL